MEYPGVVCANFWGGRTDRGKLSESGCFKRRSAVGAFLLVEQQNVLILRKCRTADTMELRECEQRADDGENFCKKHMRQPGRQSVW